MHRNANVGFLIVVFLAACTPIKPSPPATTPVATGIPIVHPAPTVTKSPASSGGSPTSSATSPVGSPPAAASAAAPAEAAPVAVAKGEPAGSAPVTSAAVAEASAGAVKAKPSRFDGRSKAPPPADRTGAAMGQVTGAATSGRPPASMALDLASLEQRLRDTHAIGVFTKLSLKNQVDDLLNAFREFHGGRLKTTLANLRQRYDLLLLKVLTVLQDGDPPLASAISASRDAIWGILVDREKFQKILIYLEESSCVYRYPFPL